jgi:F-type H+-transporting ATPase subunit gamma
MPSLLDLRRRVKSVKNTRQITKAMKMLSAAKLKRAQDAVTSARPFADKITEVLGNLSANISDDFSHPLLDARGDERYLIVLITADKGLCGGFNANLIKAGARFINASEGKSVELIPVGRKGRDFFRRRSFNLVHEYIGLTGKGRVDYAAAADVAREVIKRFTGDEKIDKVFLVYSEFKSVLSQKPSVEQLLPAPRPAQEEASAGADYIYEQQPAEIFSKLLPQMVETRIFRALLESVASEHGSRMTAMDSATKNANDLINRLTLELNRKRQAAITTEIIEVVSGAAAAG